MRGSKEIREAWKVAMNRVAAAPTTVDVMAELEQLALDQIVAIQRDALESAAELVEENHAHAAAAIRELASTARVAGNDGGTP